MRPSYLDRKQEQPASGTPTLKDHVSNEYANQGEIDERNAALAKVADLEQALASAEGELHRMTARADEAIEQMRPTHESLAKVEAEKAEAVTRADAAEARISAAEDAQHRAEEVAAEAQAELQTKTEALAEAESQIAELTKPKESTDEASPKRKKGE